MTELVPIGTPYKSEAIAHTCLNREADKTGAINACDLMLEQVRYPSDHSQDGLSSQSVKWRVTYRFVSRQKVD